MQQAVQKITQSIGDIRKEANLIASVASADRVASKKKVMEIMSSATATGKEATSLVERLAAPSGDLSQNEQNLRKLQSQKLRENLQSVTKELEAAWRTYEVQSKQSPRGKLGRKPAGVELSDVDSRTDAPLPVVGGRVGAMYPQQRELQVVSDVALAEAETHNAIVNEYATDITNLNSDIQTLHQAMQDIATHAQAQGETLDNIEAQMSSVSDNTSLATEQLVIASQTQRRGTKCYCWILLASFFVAVAIIVIVMIRHI